jgi:hypothetical protein
MKTHFEVSLRERQFISELTPDQREQLLDKLLLRMRTHLERMWNNRSPQRTASPVAPPPIPADAPRRRRDTPFTVHRSS